LPTETDARARERTPKLPLGPLAGAVKVTVASATGLSYVSVTVTASRIGKRVPTVVDCLEAEPPGGERALLDRHPVTVACRDVDDGIGAGGNLWQEFFKDLGIRRRASSTG
jgi:hypothetical protein